VNEESKTEQTKSIVEETEKLQGDEENIKQANEHMVEQEQQLREKIDDNQNKADEVYPKQIQYLSSKATVSKKPSPKQNNQVSQPVNYNVRVAPGFTYVMQTMDLIIP